MEALQAWAQCKFGGEWKKRRRSILNRLLARFAGSGPAKASRYELELIRYYRDHGLQDEALESLEDAIKARD